MIDKIYIIKALSNLYFTDQTQLIDTISAIVIRQQNIGFSIEVDETKILEAQQLKNQATNLLENLTGCKVTIVITNTLNGKDALVMPNKTVTITNQHQLSKTKIQISGVKKIICIASGKGGVGKSTIAAVLAQTLHAKGYKTGIVDLDVLGPSIPKIFGIENYRSKIENGKFVPINIHGISIMSIGLLVEQTQSLVWRGPMISKIINQLLCTSYWNVEQELDFLIIDTPPGTGDVHLSLLEKYHINHVIFISTPQDLAIIDVAKSIDMYQKFNIPILGIIENMAYLENAPNKLFIFGQGGGQRLANHYNITLLDSLPINPEIVTSCDQGKCFNNFLSLNKTIMAIKEAN